MCAFPLHLLQDAEARIEFEKELRQQLARQAAAHSDHLKDVLRVQCQEMEKQCEREMHRQLLQERQSFQTEVAGWIARLKGIESAVEGRISHKTFLSKHSVCCEKIKLLVLFSTATVALCSQFAQRMFALL